MDESALRILIGKLEASRYSFHGRLEFFTALVVAGVVLEFVFVIWEYYEELHDFRLGFVHPPEKPILRLFVLGIVGTSLVAIGVTGEFREEANIGSVETEMQTANGELYLLLSNEAGDAKKSAGSAHAEADETKQETATLKVDLAQARARLENLKQDTVKAESDLQKFAENLAKTALSRRISDPEKFIAALKGKTQAKILLLYAPNDAESFDFAFNIWTLLGRPNGAGWDVSAPTPVPQDWPTPIGWPELETAPPAIKCGAGNGRAVGMRSGIGFEIAITDMMALRTLIRAFSDDGFSTSTHTGQPLARPGQPGISDPNEIVLCVGQR